MSTEILTLHVPRSDDGETEFARLADIFDHLATTYAWHPYAYAHLLTLANDARKIDQVMGREGSAQNLTPPEPT